MLPYRTRGLIEWFDNEAVLESLLQSLWWIFICIDETTTSK